MKKTLDYYMNLPYRIEIIPDTEEGGYAARYPELPGCITCAQSIDELMVNAVDAKRTWLMAALEDEIYIPEPISNSDIEDVPTQYKLRIPRSLYSSLREHAQKEGISMNQYCVYLLTKNDSIYEFSR